MKRRVIYGAAASAALLAAAVPGLASAGTDGAAASRAPAAKAVGQLKVPAAGKVAAAISGPAGQASVVISGGKHPSIQVSEVGSNAGSAAETNTGFRVGDLVRVRMVSETPPPGSQGSTIRYIAVEATDLRDHQSIGSGNDKLLTSMPRLQYSTKSGESSTTEITYTAGPKTESFSGQGLLSNTDDTKHPSPNPNPWPYDMSSFGPQQPDTLWLQTLSFPHGKARSLKALGVKSGDRLDVTLSARPTGDGVRVLVKDLRNGNRVNLSLS
ncbi:MAG TPA: hypothetical protein VKV06_04250 [Acidimicrobiales bacterium]|nr:hypothetical protein [Acidimicrobiales bacterium]